MKHAVKFWGGLCVCLFLIVPQGAWGAEITVVTEDWKPYNFQEGDKIVGFSTEIVEAVLQKANLSFTIELFPWARSYKMALEEKNVLIYTIARTEEREHLFKWVGPFAPRLMYLFKLKKRTDIVLNTLEDAKKHKIGVVREDATTQLLLQHGFEVNKQLELAAAEDINQRKLFAERIDLIAGSELSVALQLKDMGLAFADLEKTIVLAKGDYYMAFSQATDDDIVERVRKALNEVQQEGLIEKIKAKYLSYSPQ